MAFGPWNDRWTEIRTRSGRSLIIFVVDRRNLLPGLTEKTIPELKAYATELSKQCIIHADDKDRIIFQEVLSLVMNVGSEEMQIQVHSSIVKNIVSIHIHTKFFNNLLLE